jgi:putative transposase
MIPYFGGILSGRMNLSETGIIVHDFWLEIPCHYSNTQLDEFIVMPDHIHGIIILTSISGPKPRSVNVKSGNQYWKSYSIGSIINQFKRICTIKTKSIGLDFSWQPRFYDHIIRSDNELNRIRTYIKNNPNNWLNKEHDVNSNVM